jgi:hypothetical protein
LDLQPSSPPPIRPGNWVLRCGRVPNKTLPVPPFGDGPCPHREWTATDRLVPHSMLTSRVLRRSPGIPSGVECGGPQPAIDSEYQWNGGGSLDGVLDFPSRDGRAPFERRSHKGTPGHGIPWYGRPLCLEKKAIPVPGQGPVIYIRGPTGFSGIRTVPQFSNLLILKWFF